MMPPARSRPRGPWALGPAPARHRVPGGLPLARALRFHLLASPDTGVPLVVWLGLGLLAAAVPALGLRRRRRRAAATSAAGAAPGAYAPSDAA